MPVGSRRKASRLDPFIRAALSEGPRVRQFIESTLVYGHGVAQRTVRDRLTKLSRHSSWLVRREIPYKGSNRKFAYLYSLREPSDAERNYAAQLLRERDRVLDGNVLGVTAQNHVYGLLMNSLGRFKRPTKVDLGRHGNHDCDIIAQHRIYSDAGPFLYEVKNELEFFQPSAHELMELVEKAINENAVPFFVAAHITDEAIRMCRALGIGVLHLKRQLIPKSHEKCRRTRPSVDRLRDTVLGKDTPYEFVGMKRFYHETGMSWQALRDRHALCLDQVLQRTISHWLQHRDRIRLLLDKSTLDRGALWAHIRETVPSEAARRYALVDIDDAS